MLVLTVKFAAEVLHEHTHHGLVGVAHRQADPDVAEVVDRGDHADPWLKHLGLDAPVSVHWPPVHAAVVGHTQPRFYESQEISTK